MRFIYAFILVSFFTTQLNAQPVADKIIGMYFTPKKEGKVSIYKKGNQYFGKLIWAVKNPKDVKNPNAQLRSRNIVGSDILNSFIFKKGEYVDGKIYDPTSGKTYDGKMWLEGNKLNLRGFVGMSLFGRTEVFEKI